MSTNQSSNLNIQVATFAGGCFWCMVSPFYDYEGVIDVKSGYTGGHKVNPTYREVCSGDTGHYEAIQVIYDPSKISYKELLDIFWTQIDPTDPGGQFHDRGQQYATAIFYHDDEQRKQAEESRKALSESGKFDKSIATLILKESVFYPAEEYHQDFHEKNPEHYQAYKSGSGRADYIEKVWGVTSSHGSPESPYPKPPQEHIRNKLSDMQYKVTQENATEPPFKNEYWDHKEEGIYVDIVSGEPLFSSLDKFDSSCGWPSFSSPLEKDNVKEKTDFSHNMHRIEVRSKHGDSHLGHVFTDGPAPTGLRFCINSAAVRFIPKENLAKEGYEEYLHLFKK